MHTASAAAAIENPNDAGLKRVKVTFDVKAAGGSKSLATHSTYVDIAAKSVAFASYEGSIGAERPTLKVTVERPTNHQIAPVSVYKFTQLQYTAQSKRRCYAEDPSVGGGDHQYCREEGDPGTVSGEIQNPSDQPANYLSISCALFSPGGTIIAGGFGSVRDVPAKAGVPTGTIYTLPERSVADIKCSAY